jgi:hypothetical protein
VNFIELKTINTLTKEPRKTIIKKKIDQIGIITIIESKNYNG